MHNAIPPVKPTRLKVDHEVEQSAASIRRQDLISIESRSFKQPSTRRTAAEARIELNQFMQSHPFWNNSLFQACRSGSLSRSDFQLIFGQYSLYSQNFTRYLAGLMANMELDALRVKLIDNLWEEGGGMNPDERHTEIFRKFLQEGLNINVSQVQYLDSTVLFVKEYLDFCLRSPASLSSAFLSLGTEAIVSRMYGILVEGLLKAGISETHLHFFRLHMEVDDAHAETLEEIMMAYSDQPYWFIQCQQSIEFALSLRMRFFEQLYRYVSCHL